MNEGIFKKIINEQEHAYGRFMTDDSFDYLLQYLMLSIERIRKWKCNDRTN